MPSLPLWGCTKSEAVALWRQGGHCHVCSWCPVLSLPSNSWSGSNVPAPCWGYRWGHWLLFLEGKASKCHLLIACSISFCMKPAPHSCSKFVRLMMGACSMPVHTLCTRFVALPIMDANWLLVTHMCDRGSRECTSFVSSMDNNCPQIQSWLGFHVSRV